VSRDEARDSVTVQPLPQGRSGALFVLPKVPLVILNLRVKKLADASLVLQLVDVPMLQVALLWVAVTVRRAIPRVHCFNLQYLPVLADGTLSPLVNKLPNATLLRLVVLIDRPSVTSPSRVILGPVLIAHLPTALAPSILPALRKALIQVGADDALVQLRAANVLHAVQRILVGVVLDEAESARRLLEAVEAHDQALDLAALGEELVDLLLGGVEGEVADVERGCVAQLVFGRGGAAAVVVARVAVAFALLQAC
jgi:hypothetical protein